jgi:signal transduction histidine kinase
LKKSHNNPEQYINELKDKIIDLSLKLKAQSNLLELAASKNNKLITTLTHNIKNPIGIAFSFSDMILEDADNYTPEKLEKHLKIIRESSQYAIHLLNTFVTFQQINSSNCVYNFEMEDYSKLIYNVVNNVIKSAPKKTNIYIKNTLETPILLNIDIEKITLVLQQILQNAIRFSKENTEITVEVTKNNTYIETTISDKGIGISEKDLNFVFNDFFVVNTYDLFNQKCIGLGLSTSQNIIKKHGGSISIKSIINKGTTVKISLPITI